MFFNKEYSNVMAIAVAFANQRNQTAGLNRFNKKPLKINKETTISFLFRFINTLLFNKLEIKNSKSLPYKEK